MMTMPTMPSAPRQHINEQAGGRLVSTDGRQLPLVGSALEVEASGGLARVVLKQEFDNPYDQPLSVRYQLPLPAEGAVSGFAFTIGDERVVGQVDTKTKARDRYERAILEGRSAALLEQDRSSLFTQDVGNIPAGERVHCEVVVDQKLLWLADGNWQWRFPTVVAPRYMGGEGRVRDASRMAVDVANGPISPRAQLSLCIADELAEGARPHSPSHTLHVIRGRGVTDVGFVDEQGARLDRDVVVNWQVAANQIAAGVVVARPGNGHARGGSGFGLLTLVPPSQRERLEPVARDLIVLLDTSGSMHGEPLEQARRLSLALVDTLTDRDSLELIEFSMRPRRWKRKPQRTNAATKQQACAWLRALRAGGGTEMHSGIVEALRSVRGDAQRQVVLITDGLIGFESEIVSEILSKLPQNARLHTVGVGSAINRSLTGPAARAGRGVEIVLGIGEDPEKAAARLVAHTDAPLVVDLAVSGSALIEQRPERLPDLFAGCPALIATRLDPAGGEIIVRGRMQQGRYEHRIQVASIEPDSGPPALAACFAREAVEDLEMKRAADGPGRSANQLDERITALGLDYQIATRLTSWVAVSDGRRVDPRDPSRRETIPHELPHGMSVQQLGLRPAAVMAPAMAMPPGGLVMGGYAPPPAPGGPPAPAAPSPVAAQAYDSFADEMDDLEETPADAPWEPEPLSPQMPESRSRGRRGFGRRMVESVRELFSRPSEMLELQGRAVVTDDVMLVLEVELRALFEWLPGDAVITLSDGRQINATIDLAITTRPATLQAGQILRLALEWTEPLSGVKVVAITLQSDGQMVRISL